MWTARVRGQNHLRGGGAIVDPAGAPDPINLDRRDAMLLARLARSGDLKAVRIPGARDEAVRDLD